MLMRGAFAAAGMAVGGALSCLAIPLTVGIIGLSDLAALGANLGLVAIVVAALLGAWTVRTRLRGDVSASGDRDG
jgi:hypothetical protein